MRPPSWEVFKAAMDYGYPEEHLEEHNESADYGYDDAHVVMTLEEFTELVKQYKQVSDEVKYVSGDPTNRVVLEHLPSKTFWMRETFHDSWNGGEFEPYSDHPVQVELKQVVVDQWVVVE